MGMSVSVIINNYNYGEYVCEAVDSVLKQRVLPEEIIVVDDGSTDDSREILDRRYGSNEIIKLIYKENGGQLSAFNVGYEHCTGDIIFFLDADDFYREDHIELCLKEYLRDGSIDYVYTAYQYFGAQSQLQYNTTSYSRSMGYSLLATMLDLAWIGGPTSMISLRRSLAERIFPYPVDWFNYTKHNADIGVVQGSSILGGKKYYIAEPSVFYRAHASNFDLNKSKTKEFLSRINDFQRVVCAYYFKKVGLSEKDITPLAIKGEFFTIERPTKKEYKLYIKLIFRCEGSFFSKIACGLAILKRGGLSIFR